MLKLATIVDANRTRCTKLQSPRTRNRKNGGTPLSVSATKGSKSPTVKTYKRIAQCNQSMKAKNIVSAELDDNKENEFSFLDHQIEGLAKQVNSIGL